MRHLIISLTIFCMPAFGFAQSSEFGLTLGAANVFGDLGGGQGAGNILPKDLDISATRPAIGIMFRQNMNPFMSLRFNGLFAQVSGSDTYIDINSSPGSPDFIASNGGEAFRYYRKLDFKTNIYELSAQYELNLMRYEIGRRRYRFAPYLFVGIGGFYFNPKSFDGTELQPIGTEGQFLVDTAGNKIYPDRDPYKRIQVCIPTGFGIKYNISDAWSLGFEYSWRWTFTDYIDDVSTTYVSQEDFTRGSSGYDPSNPANAAQAADLGYAYSRRSHEHDPEEVNGYITQPGMQRGDPSDFDHYILSGIFTLTYTVKKGRVYCPKF